MPSETVGAFILDREGIDSEMPGGQQSPSHNERASPQSDATDVWPKHAPDWRTTWELPAGMEGILPPGGNAPSVRRSGWMATSPSARHTTKTLASHVDHSPRAAGAGITRTRSGGGGRQWAPVVEELGHADQHGLSHELL